MDRLGLLETFVSALDEGSLSAAGLMRGISQSAVSQQIRQLETQMGQQLLHRTPKGVSATRAGVLVREHALKLLERHDLMLAELDALGSEVAGRLRLSVGFFLGREVLAPVLIDLGKAHPDLDIVLKLEDRLVDVVREGYDLAIRAGKLGETSGYGRKIAALETVFFATPSYLDQNGRPDKPDDLRRLKYIQNHEDQTLGFFPVTRDGIAYEAPLRIGFTADDPAVVFSAVKSGAGYTRAARMFIQDDIDAGTYEEILPGYRAPTKDLYAVTPTRIISGSKIEIVIDAFLASLSARDQETDVANTNRKLTA